METIFIPSLLAQDYKSFFIKLIIVFALWIIAIIAGLIDQLPEDVKIMVEEKLSTEVHDAEVIEEI